MYFIYLFIYLNIFLLMFIYLVIYLWQYLLRDAQFSKAGLNGALYKVTYKQKS